jgi:hypothetical protein
VLLTLPLSARRGRCQIRTWGTARAAIPTVVTNCAPRGSDNDGARRCAAVLDREAGLGALEWSCCAAFLSGSSLRSRLCGRVRPASAPPTIAPQKRGCTVSVSNACLISRLPFHLGERLSRLGMLARGPRSRGVCVSGPSYLPECRRLMRDSIHARRRPQRAPIAARPLHGCSSGSHTLRSAHR